MVNSNQKGDSNERELVNYLDSNGWAAIRAPASGSATQRELPDVLVGNGDRFYAIEAKRASDSLIYYDSEEVEALVFFAKNFGATPLLGGRWDEESGDPSYGEDWPGHYFYHPDNAYTTGTENKRLKKETALEDGMPIKHL